MRKAFLFLGCGALVCGPLAANGQAASTSVLTHHYDYRRTGWNKTETTLTQNNVQNALGAGTFGSISVGLDDAVDAQPLVVPGLTIAGGIHDVVYVVTESNTVYAIDASSGAILVQRNLGVSPRNTQRCGTTTGIRGTPVIDLSKQTIYLLSFQQGPAPVYNRFYQLYVLKLADLTDAVSPITVTASHMLNNGTTVAFDANYQMQRPALLESGGNIYAGFGSFCDHGVGHSRGWLLGWNATTLAPLPSDKLDNRLATSPRNFFLSSIWMSGSGPAADSGGLIYFSTGNSDSSGTTGTTTYDGVYNLQESIVRVSPSLGQFLDKFTPSNVAYLDANDLEIGSGGVLKLPSAEDTSSPYNLLAAAGKDGRMFLLNALNLGGYTSGGPEKVLATVNIGGCWCGLSYFEGPDGVRRIVSSGGNTIIVWKIIENASSVQLVQEGTAQIPSGQDPGFFTSVSSNNKQPGSSIIWAVARPTAPPYIINLYAFGASPSNGILPLLGVIPAGNWSSTVGNANIVPVVANGKVYVASYKMLTIFGLNLSPPRQTTRAVPKAQQTAVLDLPDGLATGAPGEITGILASMHGSTLIVQDRTNKSILIDAAEAFQADLTGVLVLGQPFTIQGSHAANGKFIAAAISRAMPSSANWPSDR